MSQVNWPETVTIITGASGGIGAATGEEIARRGGSVGLVARRRAALETVAQRTGGAARIFVADVSRREEVRRTVADAIAAFGRIDVWINNVGRGITRQPSELTDDDVDQMVTINIKTALYGMQEVLPHFRERGRGHIINVSSLLGRMPMAVMRSAYTASKHFLNALTANFRDDIQETHPEIQVSLVSPGVVRTDFGNNAVHGGPDSRTRPNSQSAEEVAVVIADVIASRRPDVYTRPGARDAVIGYYEAVGEDP